MKLSTLRGQFLKRRADKIEGVFYDHVDKLDQADGLMFLCPTCYAKNDGMIGTHSIICWFKGKVADDVTPGPGRWTPSGTKMNDLTLSPSVHLSGGGCGCHIWVRNGETSDC